MNQQERDALEKWFNERPELRVTHYQGGGISSWNISSDGLNVQTGDGGALLLKESFEKQIDELYELVKKELDSINKHLT